MNNKISSLLLGGICMLPLVAQAQKKQFTMAEATNGMATTLAPANIKQPSWEPGTDKLWQQVNNGAAWMYTDFSTGKSDTLLTADQLSTGTKDSYGNLPSIKWLDESHVYFIKGSKLVKGVTAGAGFKWEAAIKLPEGAENIAVDKSRKVAFTVDNNLWLMSKDGAKTQITNDAEKNIVNGKSVHRDEFGIDKGIFFSPDANYLAYYRMDQTMVADYPIIRWGSAPAKVDIIKYPMAGGTSHQVTLCVYNMTTGKTVTMQTGEPKDQYLTSVSWSPDEKYVFIALLNRDQNHLWLNQYDARTGAKVRTLFEETNPKYVHPMHNLTFLPGSNDKFIWWSERDGYDHLYLYHVNGKLIRQLTKGKWVVNEIVGFDRSADKVIITAAKESPLEKHIYTVNWNNANIGRLDKGAGMHAALASEDGKYVFDTYQGPSVPRRCMVYGTERHFSKVLLDAPNTLADYDRPAIKNITIKADDGTPLYGKLILPTNFDSSRKYPVIVYLYNGPNVQLIHNSFPQSGNLWYEYMAQHGYIVFTMDGRGSSNRGLAFEQVTFRKLGQVEMQDQLKGVDYLKSLPYVDANRMGVHGWSFGGFMTTSLMLKHPGMFKVAVAGGPVMDWKMYEVMYTERYMDTPEQNPEGYEQANLLDKVKNLQGKLLLIHGTDDNTVVWQHSIDFLQQSVSNGVQVDYYVYPGHEHNVRGKDRVHLMQKITDYFDQNLK